MNVAQSAEGEAEIEPVLEQSVKTEGSDEAKKNEEKTPVDEGGQFTCALCQFSERYHAHGSSLPFARGVVFNEDAYAMRDPFVPYGKNLFMFLGAACSSCERLVCIQCSFFYAKRFCRECAVKHVHLFPAEVQKKVSELDANKPN